MTDEMTKGPMMPLERAQVGHTRKEILCIAVNHFSESA